MQPEKTFNNPAMLIAGPTASGKSALALAWARHLDAIIINADSMQVYDTLRVLTARPDETDMAAVPHRLYGHVAPETPYSTGRWMREVRALLSDIGPERPVIFVGGTGLYMRALTHGLSPMPHIPNAIRTRRRAQMLAESAAALHAELTRRDPRTAQSLEPGDTQRIVRALEVLDASGRSIREWQAMPGTPVIRSDAARRLVLMPDRAVLHERINTRFSAMIDNGAAEEVRALTARTIDPQSPVMKAIGVQQIADWLSGKINRETAIFQAQAATRQYAKRQMTWFRNQLGSAWTIVESPEKAVPD